MKKNKGITLVALVLTIIVLLILSGVSLSSVMYNNNLLPKTGIIKYLAMSASDKEQIMLAIEEAQLETFTGSVNSSNINIVENMLGETATENGNGYVVKMTETNNEFYISENGEVIELYSIQNARGKKYNSNVAIKDIYGNIIMLPYNYVISGIEAESTSVADGVVIYELNDSVPLTDDIWTATDDDGLTKCLTSLNQYVWIPCESYKVQDTTYQLPLSRRTFPYMAASTLVAKGAAAGGDNHTTDNCLRRRK